MAIVTGMTAAEIEQELGSAVVSGAVDPNTSRLLLRTKAGAVIDAGSVGSSKSVTPYTHIQDVASTTWTINHNLGRYPQVTIVDSGGNEVVGDLLYNDQYTVTATFGAAFGGRAYLT